jgi:hypothetical protein
MVLGVWRSQDRRCRVEVVRERGRQLYRVWHTTYRIGDCRDLVTLESVLRDGGVNLAELVED